VRTIGDQVARQNKVFLLDDSQMFGGLFAEEYDVLPAGLRVFGDHGAFVGGGIASATGLALGAADGHVLCCVGDQGFTNGLQGLVAARQENAPVVFLVCNNGGSVSLRRQSRAASELLDAAKHHYLSNSDALSYTELAKAAGVPASRIDLAVGLGEQPDRVRSALRRFEMTLADALATPGPVLIEIVLPSDPDFWTGIWVTEGLEAVPKSALLFDLSSITGIAGMDDLVKAAIADRVPWAVVTGCPRDLAYARLDAAGYPRPVVLVAADDVIAGKPSPDGYLYAAKALGVPIERCVVFEDTESGVAAGRAAGASVIGIPTSPDQDLGMAHRVVTDVTALGWPLKPVRDGV
jgi:phosphoglycolate phosphatase-like HAD superfamily hydrolase